MSSMNFWMKRRVTSQVPNCLATKELAKERCYQMSKQQFLLPKKSKAKDIFLNSKEKGQNNFLNGVFQALIKGEESWHQKADPEGTKTMEKLAASQLWFDRPTRISKKHHFSSSFAACCGNLQKESPFLQESKHLQTVSAEYKQTSGQLRILAGRIPEPSVWNFTS